MPFSASRHISVSSLETNTVLPLQSHLTSTLTAVQRPSGTALRIRLKASIPKDEGVSSDYVLSAQTGGTKYFIEMLIQAEPGGRSSVEYIPNQVVDEARRLTGMMRSPLTIDMGGMRIVDISRDVKNHLVARVEGSGNRLCAIESGEEFTLLPALAAPSQTPAWFATPPDNAESTHQATPPVPKDLPGPSRMRPLTSLAIPNFRDIPTKAIHPEPTRNNSTSSPTAISLKRSKSPEKVVEQTREVKKGRMSDTGVQTQQAVVDEKPETIDSVTNGDSNEREQLDDPNSQATPAASIPPTSIPRPASALPHKPLKQSPRSSSPPQSTKGNLTSTIANNGQDDAGSSHNAQAGSADRGSQSPTRSGTGAPGRYLSYVRQSSPVKGFEDEQRSNSPEKGLKLNSRQNSEADVDDAVSFKTTRQKAEEEILANRRREAETKARAEAEAKRAERETAIGRLEDDAQLLTQPFVVGSIRYTPLKQLQEGSGKNVFGVVLDLQGMKKTSKGDWITTVIIADPSTHTDGVASDDLAVSVFRQSQAELPTKLRRGTPVLFRNLKVNRWKDKPKGNAYKPQGSGLDANTWVSLDKSGNIRVAEEAYLLCPLSDAETERLRSLRRWWDAQEEGQAGSEIAYVDESRFSREDTIGDDGGGKRRDVVLGEVRNREFFTAVVKVLQVITNGYEKTNRPSFELYVTDGTVSVFPTRNWHNVSDNHIPPSAIFPLAIFGQQPPHVAAALAPGNVVEFKNVRVNEREGLELKWSEKVTPEQVADGWKTRKCYVIPKEDDRVRVINTRLNAFKRGENPPLEPSRARTIQPAAPAELAGLPSKPMNGQTREVPLATHVGTIYNNEIEHPCSEISDVINNSTIPNKFRVRARVVSLHSRGSNGNTSFVQYHCTKCKRQFTTAHCLSCNDDSLSKAELRYRFIALLEQADTTLPVVIADQEAAAFLPPLPPITKTSNPNDHRKIQTRIKEACEGVNDILLGAKMNGERSRPIIDWSLETFEAKQRRSGKDETVVVVRAFGMRSS